MTKQAVIYESGLLANHHSFKAIQLSTVQLTNFNLITPNPIGIEANVYRMYARRTPAGHEKKSFTRSR